MNNSLFLAAGLMQALSNAAGVINAIGFIAVFGGLIGAAIMALSERHIGGVKTAIVIALVAGLAFLIVGALFTAGGQNVNMTIGGIN